MRILIALMIGLTLNSSLLKAEEENVTIWIFEQKDIGTMSIDEAHSEIIKLRTKIKQLEALKEHFYEFRKKVYYNIPMDYLSKLTLDDFDFDNYLEEE